MWDATRDSGKLFGSAGCTNASVKDEEAKVIRAMEVTKADSIGVSPLGSGSDYTVFLQRIGVSSTRASLIVDNNMFSLDLGTQYQRWIRRYPS